MLVVLLGKTTLKKKNRKNLRAFLSCGDCFKNKELLAYKEKSDEKSWLLQKAPTQLYSSPTKNTHIKMCVPDLHAEITLVCSSGKPNFFLRKKYL